MTVGKVPHLVQYQGSKRLLAPAILTHMPVSVDRLVEPFCGVCAVSIAAAFDGRAKSFWLNDINAPLVTMMEEAIEHPDRLLTDYTAIWSDQFDERYAGDHVRHFLDERAIFNESEENRTPARLLYLIARCVKGAVRYKSDGTLNQSPDKRRHGTNPKTLERNLYPISMLLKGKCVFTSQDYQQVFKDVGQGDWLYMDPPYQGTSFVRDHRYLQGVLKDELEAGLADLNSRNIPWLLSYDGQMGDKTYGTDISPDVGTKLLLDAGRSTQATLMGQDAKTLEALYVSPVARALTA